MESSNKYIERRDRSGWIMRDVIIRCLARVGLRRSDVLGLVDDPELVADAKRLGAAEDGYLQYDSTKSITEWTTELRAGFPELAQCTESNFRSEQKGVSVFRKLRARLLRD